MLELPTVVAVCLNGEHRFSKTVTPSITLLTGLGVEGDAHAGVTVKHRSRVAKDPTQPNLRQVHLMHEELFDEVARNDFGVKPGEMGENVTTRGIDLLTLLRHTVLRLGADAVVEVTGLRNPCAQINNFQPGLLKHVAHLDADGHLMRKAGIMCIVLHGGKIEPGDPIRAELPPPPHLPLEEV